jgi:hypothetical protein
MELLRAFPELRDAFPEEGPRAWPQPCAVAASRGGNPAWLPLGSVTCLMCNEYSCHDHCAGVTLTQQRQSAIEYLSASKARRATPTLPEALASVAAAMELFGLPPQQLPPAAVSALHAFFARHGDAIRRHGGADAVAAMCANGELLPWEDVMGAYPGGGAGLDLESITRLRMGRAMWRLTRFELLELTDDDAFYSALFLSFAGQGLARASLGGAAAGDALVGAAFDAVWQYAELLQTLLEAGRAKPALWRARCELAPLYAPEPEGPESFGKLNWAFTENGTPWPTPRRGWFTLFARLPRAARADTAAVAARAAKALRAAGLVARATAVAQRPRENALFPAVTMNSDVLMACKDANGHTLCRFAVSDRWVPAPAAGLAARPRFGNHIVLTWCPKDGGGSGAGGGGGAHTAVRKALRAAFAPLAAAAGDDDDDEGSGGGGATAAPAAADAGAGWACCTVPHAEARVPIAGRPELTLVAESGEAPDKPPVELSSSGRRRTEHLTGLATMWRLMRRKERGAGAAASEVEEEEEEVARCLMTYQSMDVGAIGPTIELLGVRNRCRGAGLGRALHAAIASELLSPHRGCMAQDARIGLQASYVTSSHGFFEKVGYLWAEETEDGKTGDPVAAIRAAMAGGGAGADMMLAMRGMTGRKQEDGVLPLHRAHACSACGAGAPAGGKLLVCARCRCALFCSVACQRAAWGEHKAECRKLTRVFKH